MIQGKDSYNCLQSRGVYYALQKDLVYPIAKGLLTVQSHPLELNITACNYFWLVELKNSAWGLAFC